MPQLDLTGFPPQIIWLVITFVILWLLMAKFALPRVGLVLEERQKKIDENLDLAENLRDEAKGALDAYEKSISEAKDNARGAIAEAIRQMSDTSQNRHAENLYAKFLVIQGVQGKPLEQIPQTTYNPVSQFQKEIPQHK